MTITSKENFSPKTRLWIGRFLILVVFFWNVQAAVLFLLRPQDYTPGFELGGVPGQSIIQGIGLLFLMWNVPYFVALLNPVKFRVSLIEAILMQAIGVIGESILRAVLPSGYALIESSVARFIWFDAGGLLLLLAAWAATRKKSN